MAKEKEGWRAWALAIATTMIIGAIGFGFLEIISHGKAIASSGAMAEQTEKRLERIEGKLEGLDRIEYILEEIQKTLSKEEK